MMQFLHTKSGQDASCYPWAKFIHYVCTLFLKLLITLFIIVICINKICSSVSIYDIFISLEFFLNNKYNLRASYSFLKLKAVLSFDAVRPQCSCDALNWAVLKEGIRKRVMNVLCTAAVRDTAQKPLFATRKARNEAAEADYISWV